MVSAKLVENTHYYIEEGRVVFTALFHLQRGSCCGNGCKNCPYEEKHIKGCKIVAESYKNLDTKEIN